MQSAPEKYIFTTKCYLRTAYPPPTPSGSPSFDLGPLTFVSFVRQMGDPALILM